MSREPVRHGALLSAILLAGLVLVPAASAQQPCQSCESCGYYNGKPCPPWVKYRFEGPPRLKFKHGCPRPLCDPCNLPHYGYYQTCWHPWPFPPDWSHCPVPPPGTQVPYEHPGRRQTVFEPPTEAPSPRRADPAIEKGTSTEPMLPAPEKKIPEAGAPDKVVPAARTETTEPKPALPSAPVPTSEYDPHSSNPPSVLPAPLEKIGSEEPQTTPKPTVPMTPTTQEPPLSSRQDNVPATTKPLVQQVAAMTAVEQGQRPHTVGTGSSASTVRMVNSHRIMLDYDLADVPRPEQTELELWFTQDGKKWSKDQTALRGGSPYLVEVNREGTYGFTLIARRPGDRSMGPKDGEAPQVWVEVDWTKPVIHMVHAVSKQSRQLDIAWIVTDSNLARQPITLSYAERQEGPFKPFAAGIENTSRYVWQVPANVPQRVFIRVEAADLVGNTGFGQTPMAAVIR